MKTELRSRVLWWDGTSEVAPEEVPDLLLGGVSPDKIVTQSSEDIDQFNLLSDIPILLQKKENVSLSFEYNIPDFYKTINLRNYCKVSLQDHSLDNETYRRRVDEELLEIESREMQMLIRTLIYIVDRLVETGTVWGVGRGSSCSSLVLFLIGLHKVDPIKYNIPLEEFFHD